MATVSVTNTFVDATPAEAAEVNQNFADLVAFIQNNCIQRDGSLAFSAVPSGISSDPTTANEFTRKAYVDRMIPVGTIVMAGGTDQHAAPTWLLCNGATVSRATYASLFSVIGTTFGAGDGSTTFHLPNIQDRVVVGSGNSYAITTTGGASTVTLTTTEMPTHSHTIAHTHNDGDGGYLRRRTVVTGYWAPSTAIDPTTSAASAGTAHTHTVPLSGGAMNFDYITPQASATGSSGNAGSGGAHNNMQPYIALPFYIKA